MPKKLTGLAEELKELTARCDIVDELDAVNHSLMELFEKRRAALEKLSLHIESLIRGGAQGTSTADFANDPTVQKSIRDILAHEDQLTHTLNRWDTVTADLSELFSDVNQLIAKAEDLVRTLPELKPVVARAKDVLRALVEFRRPGHRRSRRLYFK